MKKKILSITIFLVMMLGSFGAVGIQQQSGFLNIENADDTFVISSDGDFYFGFDDSFADDELTKAPHDPMEGYNVNINDDVYDCRDFGLPDARNQGSCGSCWAFGTVGPLECKLWMDGDKVDLSEQYLVSCNENGYGCDGGWWAHDYHAGLPGSCGGSGAVLESDYGYTSGSGNTGTCDCSKCIHSYILKVEDSKVGSPWAFIGNSDRPTIDQMKIAIKKFGPISASVTAGSAWSSYTGGVFSTEIAGNVNHAITIVGWDDTMGGGVWIVRNSWGKSWGDNGYMYHKYNLNNIGYRACYVDGYEKINPEGSPTVTIEICSITNSGMDPIDTIIDTRGGEAPEWFYDVQFKHGNEDDTHYINRLMENKYSTQGEQGGIWIWDWKSAYSWTVNRAYVFPVTYHEVNFRIRLCDDDVISGDDLADISPHSGGGKDDDISWSNRGAILYVDYDLTTDKVTGDVSGNGDSYIEATGGGINNARIKFKIYDSYIQSNYQPTIGYSPTKLTFGPVHIGSSDQTKTLLIRNTADVDTLNYYGPLDWSVDEEIDGDIDWISLAPPLSGSIPAGDLGHELTVKALIANRAAGTYTGRIKINSDNDAIDEPICVEVSLTVTNSKDLSSIPFYKFIQTLKMLPPNLLKLLNNLLFSQKII